MYKKLKREGKLIKPCKSAMVPLPQLTALSTLRNTPKVKRALSRVVEFEMRKPGEFGRWLEDLHIEHFRAGIQERLDRESHHDQETPVKDSEEQAVAESEATGLEHAT
jgi:hypothetical protein